MPNFVFTPHTGGTISIRTHRVAHNVAPEPVGFWVDLTESNFDTSGPSGGDFFDPRLHDLIYYWDFGDTGTYAKTVNVLDDWKSRTNGLGPYVNKTYQNDGNYTVSVTVVEPSSGKTATATTSVIVDSVTAAFGASHIVLINPAGDSDFSDAADLVAAGAQTYQTNEVTLSSLVMDDNEVNPVDPDAPEKCFLFKRGETFTVELYGIDGYHHSDMMFGAYGSDPAKPILNHKGTQPSMFYTTSGFGQTRAQPNVGVMRFVGLELVGKWDASDYIPDGSSGELTSRCFNLGTRCDLILSDCKITNFEAGFIGTLYSEAVDLDTVYAGFFIDDCHLENVGGQYPIIVRRSGHPDASFNITGTLFTQPVDAIRSLNTRAHIRENFHQNFYAAKNDFFQTDSQPILKTVNAPWRDGGLVNIHSNSFEGGISAVGVATTESAFANRNTVHNVIIDSNIFVPAFNGRGLVETHATGLTVRNNMLIGPNNAPADLYTSEGFVSASAEGGSTNFNADRADEPIRIFNNSYIAFRNNANNLNKTPSWYTNVPYSGKEYTNFQVTNNLLHAPNLSPAITGQGPITSTEQLWTPRNAGYRTQFARSNGEAWPDDILNGESLTVPYFSRKDGTTHQQADFAETLGRSEVYVLISSSGNGTWREANNQISVTYNASNFTITNLSGQDWTGIGSITFLLDMGSSSPLLTSLATDTTIVRDYQPGTGSSALSLDSEDRSSWNVISDSDTPAVTKGAWQVR